MAENPGSPPRKQEKSSKGQLKIKVDENDLPWTKSQGQGETFPTKNAPQFNNTDEKVFMKQLLRVAVSAGKARNDEEYEARYVTSQYRLAKQFVTDTSADTENKMIVFAKSKDETWLRSVCEWVKETNFGSLAFFTFSSCK